MAGRVNPILRHARRLAGPPPDAGSDAELVGRLVSRHDEQAFAALMRRYGPLVWGAARRVLGREQDAEDVFQATFLLLMRRAGTIRRSDSVGSWLFGVARRLALRARADSHRRRELEQRAAVPTASVDPADAVTWAELRGALDEELARLPDKYRAPLLCYLEGLTQEETANRLGWTRRLVKDRLARGRARLRAALARRGLALSAALTGPLLAPDVAPAALAATTLEAAMSFALGEPLTAAVSAQALALMEGGLKAMSLSKLLAITAVITVAVATGVAGWFGRPGEGDIQPAAVVPLVAAVEQPPVDRQGDPLPPGALLRLGTTRFRTGGNPVRGLGFLADGKSLVAATLEGHAIQVWDAATGKKLREFSTGTLSIRDFAASPDGRFVAVSGFWPIEGALPVRGAVRVYDTGSGKELRTFERAARETGRCALAFSADGKLLVSKGENDLLRVEEPGTGLELIRHQFPGGGNGIAISSDGSMVALGTANMPRLFVWRWATEQPRELAAPRYNGRALVFSPDGKRLAEYGLEPIIRLWDVATGQVAHQLAIPGTERHQFSSLAFTPDNQTLIASTSTSSSATVHFWDAANGKYLRKIDPGGGGLSISPDGRLLAGLGGSGMMRVWDVPSGKDLSAIDEAHRNNVARIAATGTLVITASDDETIRLWDVATGQHRHKLSHDNWVRAIAVSPDGTKLASSSLDDTVRLWDVATGRMIYSLRGHGRTGGHRTLGFTPNGQVLLSWGDDLFLRKWDVVTGKLLSEAELRPTGLNIPEGDANSPQRQMLMIRLGEGTFSPDGTAFVQNVLRQFHVFDVATAKDLRQFASEGSSLTSLAVSPDGRMLLASASGLSVQTKLPDGGTRSSTSKNHLVCLWDLSSGQLKKQIMLPDGGVGPVVFSTDRKRFAFAANRPKSRIQLINVLTGDEAGVIEALPGRVMSMTFSPDGKRLITGMDDTTALVWEVPANR